jgi:hypothetical protein
MKDRAKEALMDHELPGVIVAMLLGAARRLMAESGSGKNEARGE